MVNYKQNITWWVQSCVEKRMKDQSWAFVDVFGSVHLGKIRQWVSISVYANVFRGLLNLILDQLLPSHVCQTEAEPHFFSLPLTVQPSTFCSELEKALSLQSLWGMSACMHTLTRWESGMWRAPADPQACSALIWTNPWKPWPGLSKGLHCASSYIHAAFSHSTISATFKGPGNPSAHNTVKIMCVSLRIRYPHANNCSVRNFLFPAPKTYNRVECVSVLCQTHYLSSKITLPPLHAWIARRVVQPQHWRNEHPACQRKRDFSFKSSSTGCNLSSGKRERMRVKKGFWLVIILSLASSEYDWLWPRQCQSCVQYNVQGPSCTQIYDFSPWVLMRLCWNPWVRVALIVHWLFHVREPLQTFKLIIYLRTSCLPCQAAALLLVPACAPVYIFASHKANLY